MYVCMYVFIYLYVCFILLSAHSVIFIISFVLFMVYSLEKKMSVKMLNLDIWQFFLSMLN